MFPLDLMPNLLFVETPAVGKADTKNDTQDERHSARRFKSGDDATVLRSQGQGQAVDGADERFDPIRSDPKSKLRIDDASVDARNDAKDASSLAS